MDAKTENQYACSESTFTFSEPSGLTGHLSDHHGTNRSFRCIVNHCTKSFETKSEYISHLFFHKTEGRYGCPANDCSNTFAEENDLILHVQTHQRINSHIPKQKNFCYFEKCLRLFPSAKKFRLHLRQCHEKSVFSCIFKDCTWSFTDWRYLVEHLLVHAKQNWKCAVVGCNDNQSNLIRMVQHLRNHDNRMCQCIFHNCKRESLPRDLMVDHLKVHIRLINEKVAEKILEEEDEEGVSELLATLLPGRSPSSPLLTGQEFHCIHGDCGKQLNTFSGLKEHLFHHHSASLPPWLWELMNYSTNAAIGDINAEKDYLRSCRSGTIID